MTTCSERPFSGDDIVEMDLAGIEAQIWERSALDDAPVWDGDPEADEIPGSHFRREWRSVHVDEETAGTVLDFFEGGRDPGNFASLLIRTILSADNENAEAIGVGLPMWVRAVGLWRSDKTELRRLAGR